jgi:hypothetical protein
MQPAISRALIMFSQVRGKMSFSAEDPERVRQQDLATGVEFDLGR